jgi:hypothetical protein
MKDSLADAPLAIAGPRLRALGGIRRGGIDPQRERFIDMLIEKRRREEAARQAGVGGVSISKQRVFVDRLGGGRKLPQVMTLGGSNIKS